MNFTEEQLSSLNAYLNSQENLPVEIEALNVLLREHFAQDTSVEAPEVRAAVEAEAQHAAPARPDVPAEPVTPADPVAPAAPADNAPAAEGDNPPA